MAAPDEAPTPAPGARRAPSAPRAVTLAITGPIARSDIASLCDRTRALLEDSGAEVLVCDVKGIEPDAVTVDALARLQLTARRLGRRVGIRHPCVELEDLLGLMGLRDVVLGRRGLGVEPRGQPEQREPARRIEEEDDPGDAVARDVEDLK